MRWLVVALLGGSVLAVSPVTGACAAQECLDAPFRMVRVDYGDGLLGLAPSLVPDDGADPFLVTAFRVTGHDSLYILTGMPPHVRIVVYDIGADIASAVRTIALDAGRAYTDFLIDGGTVILAYDDHTPEHRCGYSLMDPSRGTVNCALRQSSRTPSGRVWTAQSPGTLRRVGNVYWAYNAAESMSLRLGTIGDFGLNPEPEVTDGVPTTAGVIDRDGMRVYRDGNPVVSFDHRRSEGFDDVRPDGSIVTREAIEPCCGLEVCRRYRLVGSDGGARDSILVKSPQNRPYAIFRGRDHDYDGKVMWILRLDEAAGTLYGHHLGN